MKRAIWVHQFSQQSEQSPQDYADTLLPRGIGAVYVKAMDGTSWMGDFYNHPLAPSSESQFVQLVAAFKGVGLELIPWVVPRWKGSEASSHLVAASAAGGTLIIDWEYQYAGFWTGTDSEALVYYEALRQYVRDGFWVAAAPDPRQPGRDYSSAMIAELSAYLPQTYWTDFQRPAIETLSAALSTCGHLGPFEPILPANGAPEDVAAALEWCVARGTEAVSVWRMGTANAAQLDAFALKVPGEGEPDTLTDPTDPDVDYGWQAKKDLVVATAGELLVIANQLATESARKGGPRVVATRNLANDVRARAHTILD